MESLLDDLRIIRVCSDAGFMKTVAPGQYCMTEDEAELTKLDCLVSRREYTLPRDDGSSRAKGWIRENTRIGPVLEVTVTHDQGLLGDGSQSWVMISTWLNKYVTEMPQEKQENPLRRHNWSMRGETCGKSKTEANINADVIFSENQDTIQ